MKDKISAMLLDPNFAAEKKPKMLLELVFSIDDPQWLQKLCLKCAHSDDTYLAGLAVTCLGHIARIHKKLDLDIVLPFLQDLINSGGSLAGQAGDAMDDIEIFMPNELK
ncbi:MAG: hypothetical protein LUC34_03220 [Campylobacter sp.]|nr:hypothetical protein [Campylobacter sp.]